MGAVTVFFYNPETSTTYQGASMHISKGNLPRDALKGEVAVVTGAGRGIGFEAARALLWLGANVAVAEVNEVNGRIAAQSLQKEFGQDRAVFVKVDCGSESDVAKLRAEVNAKWGKVDVVVNNAAVYPVGSVLDSSLDAWELGCRVNLNAPILLARAFLPDMVKRKHGAFICVSSTAATAYLGAHGVYKAAQATLAGTLAMELEDTGVYALVVNPGVAKTPGFLEAASQAAALKGISLEQLLQQINIPEVSPEEAGAGLAAAVALAEKFQGQEVTSAQALQAIGIGKTEPTTTPTQGAASKRVRELHQIVLETFTQELNDWQKSNMVRKRYSTMFFKKNTDMMPEEMLRLLENMGSKLEKQEPVGKFLEPLKKLQGYYESQREMLGGFEKIQKKRKEGLDLVETWIRQVKALIEAIR
jgi:NAD(P)-dependent dehydrogenase (short-subunit alcohol dehydrogenase family)